MTFRVLWVDDEPNMLSSVKRLLRAKYDVDVAESPSEALEMVRECGPYSVVLSDMSMPGMNGVRLLARVRELAPDTVRILVTGHAEGEVAIDAINEGSIFRFLRKPLEVPFLLETLSAATEHYRLVTAERELLQGTLVGAVTVLQEILSLSSPAVFGRTSRVRALVRRLLDEMHVSERWPIEVATMLSQLGCVTVPEGAVVRILSRGDATTEELEMYANHPVVGAELLRKIPRLEAVAEIVAKQNCRFETLGEGGQAARLPLGARILKVALDYDLLVHSGMTHDGAVIRLHSRRGWYDPNVIDALPCLATPDAENAAPMVVGLSEVLPGLVLAEDVRATSGALLVGAGQEVTEALALRLFNARQSLGPDPKFKVFRSTRAQPVSGRGTP